MKDLLLSLGLLLLCFSQLFAQKQELDSTKTERLNEVVVTAQYMPLPEKNAVYKVNTISSKAIQNKAANNLRELLQQEGLINLSQNSVFGTSIEIQGISKENVKILIDGIPLVGRLNGIIDLNQINLSNIERVEIIEGPVSVFYGTDASGGIINLITKKTQKKTIEGVISAYYEDIDAVNYNGDLGYSFGKNLLRINVGYYHFDGLSTNDAPRNLNWEERSQYFSNFMYAKTMGDLRLVYNNRFSKEKLFSIGEPDRRGNIQDKEYHTRRIDNTLHLKGNVFNNKFIDASVSYLDYQRYHDTFIVDPATFESTPSETDVKEDNKVKFNHAGLKVQLGKSNRSDVFNYAVGTDLVNESTEGIRILEGKQRIFTAALYGSVNFGITENFEVQPAARYTWNSNYGSLFSPAFNSLFKLGDEHRIRFSYGRGFRAPSIKEIYLDFHISSGPVTFVIKGNENLEVEKSHSLNLSYNFRKALENNSGYIAIEPSFFYNDISNLIALSESVDNERQYINIDKFKSVGGALDILYKPTGSLVWKTGFSVLGRYNKFNEDHDTEAFLFTPEISTNLSYTFEKAQMTFDVFYKFSGKREGFLVNQDTNNLSRISRKSYDNLNATVSRIFVDNHLKVAVGVKNLFDVEDIETLNEAGQAHARDQQLWGRSFFLRTTFNL